jgi:hypothetical protein
MFNYTYFQNQTIVNSKILINCQNIVTHTRIGRTLTRVKRSTDDNGVCVVVHRSARRRPIDRRRWRSKHLRALNIIPMDLIISRGKKNKNRVKQLFALRFRHKNVDSSTNKTAVAGKQIKYVHNRFFLMCFFHLLGHSKHVGRTFSLMFWLAKSLFSSFPSCRLNFKSGKQNKRFARSDFDVESKK